MIATINQLTQLVVESVKGTAPGVGFKRLQSTTVLPATEVEIETFRAQGYRFPGVAVRHKEWSLWKLSGLLSYTDVIYALAGILKAPTTTRIIPSTGLAYRHVFTPVARGANARKTFTVEHGETGQVIERSSYGTFAAWSFSLTRSADAAKNEQSGALFGRRLLDSVNDAISLTSGAVDLAVRPVSTSDVCLYFADAYADLATADPMNNAFSVDWGLADVAAAAWDLNRNNDSFKEDVETPPKGTVTLELAADAIGQGFKATMRAGATKFLRIECKGAFIESDGGDDIHELIIIDCALKITGVGEKKDTGGVYAMAYTCEIAYDDVWGYAIYAEVINKLAGL
ncbi:MAG TPA: hypothetical protein VGE07_01495 [Herpetosiphonaceae bacterium]